MPRTTKSRKVRFLRALVSFLVAFGVLVFVFPFSGDDDGTVGWDYSVFHTRVPTDNPYLSLVAALVAAALTWWFVGWLLGRLASDTYWRSSSEPVA
jgi:hypothetical protein